MIDLKIRNATKDQFAIVADMARANVGTIDRCGLRNGMGLRRNGLSVYLYLTDSGKTVVAYVNDKEPKDG
jgi:hypothetical protein